MTKGIIDPTLGLKAQYEAALLRLRDELGEPRTWRERYRFRRRARALYRQLVVKPTRAANW